VTMAVTATSAAPDGAVELPSRPAPVMHNSPSSPSKRRRVVAVLAKTAASRRPSMRTLVTLAALYIAALLSLLSSHTAQNAMIYLHWLTPPQSLAPLHTLAPYRLESSGRVVSAGHLRGWHILPPGAPFAPPPDLHSSVRDQYFDDRLRRKDANKRVVIFFHGNSGTRAFPFKRVDMLRMLAAHLSAHVVTFDYTGFGDSRGWPTETQFYADARAIFDWVAERTDADTTDIVVYGQSLGTFAAVQLAGSLCPLAPSLSPPVSAQCDNRLTAVVLDAPPASLLDASMSHPSLTLFQRLPRVQAMARATLYESHDSVLRASRVGAPMLVMHGERDTFIPIEQGRRIHAAAVAAGNDRAEFVMFPFAGHNNVNAAPDFLIVLDTFLAKYVKPLQCDGQGVAGKNSSHS
jgi:pimeloyl-ACP methyl ester carboxylesterase